MLGAGVGLLGSLAGGFLGGSAASRRKRQLYDVAQTPGIALGDVYGDALGAQQGALPMAEELVSSQNRFNASELDSLLESSIPGLKGMQAQRSGNTASFLRGELPSDLTSSIFRRSGARALEGGYGGAPAGRNLVARDLGRTSLDLMRLGGSELDSALRSAPLPSILSTQDLLTIGPRETLGLRSGERAKKISDLQLAYGSPGGSDVWAKVLQDMGGTLMGSGGGFGALLGGGGGSSRSRAFGPGDD